MVCFNGPGNPRPIVEAPADRGRDPAGLAGGTGYRFSAQTDERNPLLVHYRLWIQGGRMPCEEIQAMANDIRDPIKAELK